MSKITVSFNANDLGIGDTYSAYLRSSDGSTVVGNQGFKDATVGYVNTFNADEGQVIQLINVSNNDAEKGSAIKGYFNIRLKNIKDVSFTIIVKDHRAKEVNKITVENKVLDCATMSLSEDEAPTQDQDKLQTDITFKKFRVGQGYKMREDYFALHSFLPGAQIMRKGDYYYCKSIEGDGESGTVERAGSAWWGLFDLMSGKVQTVHFDHVDQLLKYADEAEIPINVSNPWNWNAPGGIGDILKGILPYIILIIAVVVVIVVIWGVIKVKILGGGGSIDGSFIELMKLKLMGEMAVRP